MKRVKSLCYAQSLVSSVNQFLLTNTRRPLNSTITGSTRVRWRKFRIPKLMYTTPVIQIGSEDPTGTRMTNRELCTLKEVWVARNSTPS